MSQKFSGFPPETVIFLKQLKDNNNRDWFLAHKKIYEKVVKAPMIEFVLVLKGELRKFASEMLVDPARSIFRIYRDVRFSPDKRPYKTNIAAAFDPEDMRGRASAGLYFHLEPEQLFLGGGMYMPGSAELLAVRNSIAKDAGKLRKIITAPEFKKMFGKLEGERLSKMPRGFPTDHPAADLLKYKQYLAFVKLPTELAEKPEIVPETVRYFRGMMPLIRYINGCLKNAPQRLRG